MCTSHVHQLGIQMFKDLGTTFKQPAHVDPWSALNLQFSNIGMFEGSNLGNEMPSNVQTSA